MTSKMTLGSSSGGGGAPVATRFSRPSIFPLDELGGEGARPAADVEVFGPCAAAALTGGRR